MQWQEDLQQENFVLLLEREGEAVDDGAEDLQQLGDPVVPFRLVDKVVEDVVDLLPVVKANLRVSIQPTERGNHDAFSTYTPSSSTEHLAVVFVHTLRSFTLLLPTLAKLFRLGSSNVEGNKPKMVNAPEGLNQVILGKVRRFDCDFKPLSKKWTDCN